MSTHILHRYRYTYMCQGISVGCCANTSSTDLAVLLRFGLIRSYGLLGWPDLAAAAFDDMRRLGVWQPSDVKTANVLLNALHADARKTYERYS